jgi:transcriptional regulator with XRE-family HTH domain
VPFRPDRVKDLREAKGLSQQQLEKLAGLSHSAISKTEQGKTLPGSEVLDKLARALDCTIDYLHERGCEYSSPPVAAAHMAFNVFIAQENLTDDRRESCRRALRHTEAPRTAQAWRSFAEMLEAAIGPTPSSSLSLVEERPPKRKAVGVARRRQD